MSELSKHNIYVDQAQAEQNAKDALNYINSQEVTRMGAGPQIETRDGVKVTHKSHSEGSVAEPDTYPGQPTNFINATRTGHLDASAVVHRPDNARNRYDVFSDHWDLEIPAGKVATRATVYRYDESKYDGPKGTRTERTVYEHHFKSPKAIELISRLAQKNLDRTQRIERRKAKKAS